MNITTRRKARWGVLGLLACGAGMMLFSGCSAQSGSDEAATEIASRAAAPVAGSDAQVKAGGAMAQPVEGEAASIPRKIIYTAEVSLVVENLTTGQQKLLELVKKSSGYVAGSTIEGATGNPRTGSWKVRLPVNRYNSFMEEVARIGEVQTIHSDSQDVSEEYYDVQARIANKQVEEKRLIEHLKNTAAKLDDILKVEKEISRVRGEIERMQGRIRVLSNLTELATVTVTINEIKDYVPPTPPTFATQIARTFSDSFGGVIGFGKGVILLAVALAPWLVMLFIVGVPIGLLMRRRKGAAHSQSNS